MKAKEQTETDETESGIAEHDNIVIRDGKKYRRVTADKAKWLNDIF